MSIASFTTQQVSGKGRGKLLGFPTINMRIPHDLDMAQGIYAAWIGIGNARYMGALHYGPVPVFGQKEATLEVFLIDVVAEAIDKLDTTRIHVTILYRLREIQTFSTQEGLVDQIYKDVRSVREYLAS
jgi:riboflavin kinase/FMN adenylyltransferase